MSVEHYENFPVASWLCPPAIRPTVVAIYRYARTADDIADEGDASPAGRLADLAAFRADLRRSLESGDASARWPEVFGPLAAAIRRHRLPVPLLEDLLDAFAQDVVQHRYPNRAALLDYARRSANPIGRLLLHLYRLDAPDALRRSDAICTALQLANFWQDLSVDTARGRLYVPLEDCARHGVDPDALLARRDGPAVRALVRELSGWARSLMASGAALVHQVPGRAGWELRLVVQGGFRILDRIDACNGGTLGSRPTLGKRDLPVLAWRALTMRPARAQPFQTIAAPEDAGTPVRRP